MLKLSEIIAEQGDLEVFELEEVGKITRILLPLSDWKLTKQITVGHIDYCSFSAIKRVEWHLYDEEKAKQAYVEIRSLGIKCDTTIGFRNWDPKELKWETYPDGLVFYMDARIFLSSFKKSDDPKVWKQINEAKLKAKEMKHVNNTNNV